MESHIDAYIFYKFGTKISPILTNDWLSQALTMHYKYEILSDEFPTMFNKSYKPKTTQVVQRLKQMGFSPATISNWLDINATTVSYHLHKETPKEYINPYFRMLRDRWNKILHQHNDDNFI